MRQKTLSALRTDSLTARSKDATTSPFSRFPGRKRAVVSRCGFSLLEMIVVITIIAILLGISTTMLAGMKQKAQAAVTRDTAKQLAEAWTRHLQVRGEWPVAIQAPAKEFKADAAHLKILNRISGDKPEMGYYFLELSQEEKDQGLKDKWGTLFSLWFDADYDGQIAHPTQEGQTVRSAVIVGSPGKDKIWGTKDDIIVY